MVKKSERWQKQETAIRATQLAFDLSTSVQKTIKKNAIDNDLTPSDMIRKILELPVKSKKTRQRLTFYLNEEELQLLAERYQLETANKLEVKQKVAEELIQYATSQPIKKPTP